MKRGLATAILFTVMAFGFVGFDSVSAECVSETKISFTQQNELRKARRDVLRTIKAQSKFAEKYDLQGLSTLYSKDFISADGFDREVYLKLIKDTWASYPGIKYEMQIKDVEIQDNKATVSVYESSLAEVSEIEDGVKIFGSLNSSSNGKYYLTKTNDKWLFTSEKIEDEKSSLKFGDTRFVQMDLSAPKTVKSGEYYTSSLNINRPKDTLFVASICRDKIAYPQEKSEEVFRRLPEDNLLERMFISNEDGKNEYNVASIGMTKTMVTPQNEIKYYMTGMAFLITRVNIEGKEIK